MSKNERYIALTEEEKILEAILFASDDILEMSKLKQLMPDNPDARIVKKMIANINMFLQQTKQPFEIADIGGGFQFRTVGYYQPWVQRLFKDKSSKKLSVQALECLAIIAYKQPITKSTVESIRGVMSDGAIKKLLERKLVAITGRSDKPGRPLLYGTTQDFLRYFGINKLTDLPDIKEFEELARKKMKELSNEELENVGVQTSMNLDENDDREKDVEEIALIQAVAEKEEPDYVNEKVSDETFKKEDLESEGEENEF